MNGAMSAEKFWANYTSTDTPNAGRCWCPWGDCAELAKVRLPHAVDLSTYM